MLERLKADALSDMRELEGQIQTVQGQLQNLQVLYRHHQGHVVILDARIAEVVRGARPVMDGHAAEGNEAEADSEASE